MSLLWLLLFSSGTAAIKLSRDGRYSGVTLVIDENIRGQDCQVFTDNIKVSHIKLVIIMRIKTDGSDL